MIDYNSGIISYNPIGIIHTPFKERIDTPRQSILENNEVTGFLEVFPKYEPGLEGLERYPRIVLVFDFHLSDSRPLKITPMSDNKERGVFASRSPDRPNSIGVSIVELTAVKGLRVDFRGVDMLDGTPLLDIKPFIFTEFYNEA